MMMSRGALCTPAAVRGWILQQQQQQALYACCCMQRSIGGSSSNSSSSSCVGSSRGFSTDSRVIYLNSSTRRRSLVHASADLPPLFIIPRQRQQQPLLHSLTNNSNSSSSSNRNSSNAAEFFPSPLSIHMKHLIQRRRAAKRSKHHPQLLPSPPLPAAAPSGGIACGVSPLPLPAGVAAAAVGQQQLLQQQLYQLQDTQLLQLSGGPPVEGLGLAGRDVVSLSGDPETADSVSPCFADASYLEEVASVALTRWRETSAAGGSAESAAAAERDDKPFWQGLCDRIFTSRDLLPVSSLAALLRIICCRYTPAAAAAPYFMQHFSFPQQQHFENSMKQQQQRLPSQRPVSASLLLPLTREFIDDMHCLSPAAAADISAVFAVNNCCSVELLQLLVRRSIDTWLLPEQQLEQQRQQLEQQQQHQLFAMKPEAVGCFSPHEFAVFCSALRHLLGQAQPLLQRRAQQQQHQTLVQLLPLPEFLCSSASFLARCSSPEDFVQQQAALGSLAALAADALQQDDQQQHQQEQLLQLRKASVELLMAGDTFIPREDEAAAPAEAATAEIAVTAFSAKETARLMSLLSAAAAAGSSQLQQQHGVQHEQEQQQEQQQESPKEALKGEGGQAREPQVTEVLQQHPGAASLLFMLQQTRGHLTQVKCSLLQQQQQHEPSAKLGVTAAASATSRLQYVPLNPWEVPSGDALQLMASVAAATEAAATVLLQSLLLQRSQRKTQHPLQQRQQQLLLKLLRVTEAPAAAAAAPVAPLLHAAAESLMGTVSPIIAAAGASLLPAAADACRALLLLQLLPVQTPQRSTALKALVDEVGRRFADLSTQEKERLSLAVSALGIKDPYLRHLCRAYGRPLQQRLSVSAAYRNKLAALCLAAESAATAAAAAVAQE